MKDNVELSERQKLFCREYILDFNGLQAAIRAGYSQKTAKEQASRLLTYDNVQNYLKTLKQKVAEKFEISMDRVLQEYSRIAFSDITSLFNEDSTFKKFTEMTEDQKAVLSSLEIEEDREGIGSTRKVKVWDKKGALDSICKVMGFNASVTSKVQVEEKVSEESVKAILEKLR